MVADWLLKGYSKGAGKVLKPPLMGSGRSRRSIAEGVG